MFEKPIIILDVAAIQQKPGQQVSVPGIAGDPVSAAQHRAAHEHILYSKIGIARRRGLADATRRESVRRVEKQTAIGFVAGVVGQTRRGNHPGQRGPAGVGQIPGRVRCDRRDQIHDVRSGVLVSIVQSRQAQAAADAHSLRVVHRVQNVTVPGGDNPGKF